MADLTTLANAKQWLGVTSSSDDAMLSRLVSAASDYIQTWLGRTIASATYTETRDGTGGDRLMFSNYPVTAVTSLSVDGISIPLAANSQQPGYLWNATSIRTINGYSFTRGVQNVTVAYTAGYAATPNEIEQAAIELVSLRYKDKDRIGQTSKSIGGESVTFTQQDFSDAITATLAQYKKVITL
jgi:hypothetical protein